MKRLSKGNYTFQNIVGSWYNLVKWNEKEKRFEFLFTIETPGKLNERELKELFEMLVNFYEKNLIERS